MKPVWPCRPSRGTKPRTSLRNAGWVLAPAGVAAQVLSSAKVLISANSCMHRPAKAFAPEKYVQPQTAIFSIAPMMDWTDRHCRFFHRLLTRRARLYTEMVTTAAVLPGDEKAPLAPPARKS